MDTSVDFEHLAACVDKHCGYCSNLRPERDPEVQAWLDAVEAQHTDRPSA